MTFLRNIDDSPWWRPSSPWTLPWYEESDIWCQYAFCDHVVHNFGQTRNTMTIAKDGHLPLSKPQITHHTLCWKLFWLKYKRGVNWISKLFETIW